MLHLAAAVSGECEADFDLGMRSNFAATHGLLEACRTLGSRPTFVFASSLAVFGSSPNSPRRLPSATTRCPLRNQVTASRSSSASNWWPTTPVKASYATAMCGS
ncbi:MAG: NAD-dependent epimerase/dehydratase family protein [Burkholderiaceae bacterium]